MTDRTVTIVYLLTLHNEDVIKVTDRAETVADLVTHKHDNVNTITVTHDSDIDIPGDTRP